MLCVQFTSINYFSALKNVAFCFFLSYICIILHIIVYNMQKKNDKIAMLIIALRHKADLKFSTIASVLNELSRKGYTAESVRRIYDYYCKCCDRKKISHVDCWENRVIKHFKDELHFNNFKVAYIVNKIIGNKSNISSESVSVRYNQLTQYIDATSGNKNVKICSVPGCGKKVDGNNHFLCNFHYENSDYNY